MDNDDDEKRFKLDNGHIGEYVISLLGKKGRKLIIAICIAWNFLQSNLKRKPFNLVTF